MYNRKRVQGGWFNYFIQSTNSEIFKSFIYFNIDDPYPKPGHTARENPNFSISENLNMVKNINIVVQRVMSDHDAISIPSLY